MTTLTIHPASEDQETAIRIFLDALHVHYNTNETSDETDYQMSSSANAAHLKESIEQGKKGEVTKLGLDDIWKESTLPRMHYPTLNIGKRVAM